jgi:D-serine deaminase-like pyridoxal phosphate-dependent protein
MGRTGIAPGINAFRLYLAITSLPNLVLDGLHAYDGHHRATDPAERKANVVDAMKPVFELRETLLKSNLPVPRLVLGGTPTFLAHAGCKLPGVELSPGTGTLHDAGYGGKFPDLPFTPAALLLTRVISHPRPGRLTLDLGHKAVAADPVGDRLVLLGMPGATFAGQSEEHLVVETPDAAKYPLGSHFLAIPMHVCPTVALHEKAVVIRDGEIVETWDVSARARSLGI